MSVNRVDIVSAARSWVGTRFQHQGRIKKGSGHKGGVDCLGLLVGIARELNLQVSGCPLAGFDRQDYGHYPDTDALEKTLSSLLLSIPLKHKQPGDVALFSIDGNPQHLGILSDYGLIHAYAPARAVVETRLDEQWQKRIRLLFRVIL